MCKSLNISMTGPTLITRNRRFESISLQPGVCKLSVPRALPRFPRRRRRSVRCASIPQISPAAARQDFAKTAVRARCQLVERDKLLASEKTEMGGGDPRPVPDRAMRPADPDHQRAGRTWFKDQAGKGAS